MIDQELVDRWLTDIKGTLKDLRFVEVRRLQWNREELVGVADDLNDLIARITKRAA